MAGLTQLLNVARDALTAQSYGLNVTGQNISNASTPGYARRVALLETQDLGTQSGGGVVATGLKRVTNDFIERREFQATGASSAATARDQTLASIEALFNDGGGTGLGSAMSDVFSSFSALASNPNDPTTRAKVLSAVGAFSDRANDTANTIAQTKMDLTKQAQETIDQVNQRAQEIAKLDMQIAQAAMQGDDASDLKDQRTQKILNMSGLINTHTFTDSSGNTVVQVAGTTIVDGQHARTLSLDMHADGSLKLLADQSGGGGSEITQYLTGGTLAGIKEARDKDLFDVSAQLDQFVFDVGTALNTQHAAGFGADGGSGRNLFDLGASATNAARDIRVSADVFDHPDRIAAASNLFSVPGGSDNAVLLSKLFDAQLAVGNTRTAAQAYGDIVGSIGSTRASSQRDVETHAAILQQVQSMHQSETGVSLDEEMVNLTKFQNAYQAASKMIGVADQLMQTLLNTVGR
ncbi:MAG TPA: flagellar hook-associated protein FlgK [Polyangiaceae bacterium]|nr:flagellar hook-associated protein FlgK [Polyangiaceae bacterium]